MDNSILIKYKNKLEENSQEEIGERLTPGNEFFEETVIKLNNTLDADFTFIGKLNTTKSTINSIAITNCDGLISNFSYDLKFTPCENVVGQNACSYNKNVTRLFPKDILLVDMGIEAYVGVPLYDSNLNPNGILVSLFKNEISDTVAMETILTIFAAKAGAELEKKQFTIS